MSVRCYSLAIAVLLVGITATAHGATRFVTGTTVSSNDNDAVITVQFACKVEYVNHLPVNRGSRLRVQIDPTTICTGVAPSAARTQEQFRPLNADAAKLLEIDYDGVLSASATLTFNFSHVVRYEVSYSDAQNRLTVRVDADQAVVAAPTTPSSGAAGVRVKSELEKPRSYVINLSSSRSSHTAGDRILENISPGLQVFETEIELAGVTWYRLLLGTFDDSDAANAELVKLRGTHPNAWVDRLEDESLLAGDADATTIEPTEAYAATSSTASLGLDEIDALMAEARKAMVEGELSRSVQLYTKVLRSPNHERHAEAQEMLGLAREKNGQLAHAKAEYQRYLSTYPEGDAFARVQQRLAVLLAAGRQTEQTQQVANGTSTDRPVRPAPSDWRINTFWSQYYRRDANQFNEEEEIISQSAIYSDINIDARRRGSRYDFSSRLSAGYRSELLSKELGSGDDLRVSYAYADLADVETGWRGRVGRQSRNTGGVLGRFDGLNVDYRLTERVLLNAVVGQPVDSASDGLDSERTFYGVSAIYGPVIENLELGAFAIQQEIGGIVDRQAIGTEFRYFGENQSLWGLIDYDTSYNEVSSAYLQGSWRFASRLTLTAAVDQRHSPYLSTGSALVGQPVGSFEELQDLFTEDEIRQLSVDRTPLATSVTGGISYSLSPRLQLNADINQTTVEATPESGGVGAMPASTYDYMSATLVASSLFKQGDVTIFSVRYSESESSQVTSLSLDSRFPIGASWRINPRLRVDKRQVVSDSSNEWLYTPGVRIQYRRSRKLNVELEAGKQFAQRQLVDSDIDRESYFINLGYQMFF